MTTRLPDRSLFAPFGAGTGSLRGPNGMTLEGAAQLGRPATVGPVPAHAQSRQRSMARYLAVPRPGDLFKACLLPLAFAVGALAVGGVNAHMCQRAFVMVCALELLIYPARYQWNDIRGFAA